MRLLHDLEIENFKCFGDKQRVEPSASNSALLPKSFSGA
jgi:hypothetical protein